MNLAILHYHLNRGGVTQVIINQLLALDRQLAGEQWKAAILFSGRHDAWLEQLTHLDSVRVTLCQMSTLDYEEANKAPQPRNLAQQILKQLEELGFDKSDTIIHVHNHVLAKNLSLPGALLWLAEQGYPVLFQIHDFPEDYRPADFRRLVTAAKAAEGIAKNGKSGSSPVSDLPSESNSAFGYPQAPHLHYAVINRRDERVLAAAGVPSDRRHLLPNPVAEPAQWFPRETARRRLEQLFDVKQKDHYVLYPVRCIRRKNIGEAILWSLLARDKSTFGFTLPPENAVFAPVYEAWKRLARELEVPCRFEVGKEGGMRFVENIAAADLILTTSLMEGFGMVYLETWLSGHSLAGRDLPEITSDFIDSGLVLEELRPHLEISVDWIGADRYRELLKSGYAEVIDTFGVVPNTDHESLHQRIEERCDEGWIDFGELDEELQQQVLRSAAENPGIRSQLEASNAWIFQSLTGRDDGTTTVVRNAVSALQNYGLENSGTRLAKLYMQIAASERSDSVSGLEQPGRIIDNLLDARRYRPIVTQAS